MAAQASLGEAGKLEFLMESLRAGGVSTSALESLECMGLGWEALMDLESAEPLTEAEELGIGDVDAGKIVAVVSRLRDLEEGPLVFLDIDGVLNTTTHATHVRLDGPLVARLKRIVDESGGKIVFSTFWREHASYLTYILRRHDVDCPVAGSTPGAPTSDSDRGVVLVERVKRRRGEEIQDFLDGCSRECPYVILDDRDDAACYPEQRRRFVRTDPTTGLTDDDVNRAFDILRAPREAPKPDLERYLDAAAEDLAGGGVRPSES